MKGVFRKLVVKKKNHKIEKRISSKEGTDVGLFARKQPIFSLPSNGNAVDALVDGEEALMEMAESIMMAKETIFITDWRIDPDLVMVRKQGHALNGKTLVELLLSASIRGVKIRILLYNSPFFMNITKGDQKKLILEQVHPSIECVSHRWNVAYAHHQKSMVVDHQIAFLGGIDLAKGRWDTHDHFINPHTYQNNSELFPQTDYYNSLIRDKDYNETPRLAWHDIHCKIQGPAVFDVEKKFCTKMES
ncbi:phospholipase D [Entamoeba marina]